MQHANMGKSGQGGWRRGSVRCYLDEQLLDLVLEGQDLALELRGLVGCHGARYHRAGHPAGASEGNLTSSTKKEPVSRGKGG